MDSKRPTVRVAVRRCGPGEVVAARHRGRDVAVVRLTDGRVFAVDDRCPHEGARLSDGYLDGDKLVCPRHGWEFDPCTGACPLRAGVRVATRPVTLRRGARRQEELQV